MGELAFLGCHGGERRYLLGHPLASAVWADHVALFEISDMKNLGKFFVAIQAVKNVMRHNTILFVPIIALLIVYGKARRRGHDCSTIQR